MDRSFIDEYERGSEKLTMAIRGLKREDLLAIPVPGTWSIQQIAIHLADSDQVIADRIKRVVAEDNPPLLAFDENKWVKNLAYDEQSADDAAKTMELVRKQLARVLRSLPDAAFDRRGNHSERGPMTLRQLVEGASKHLDHHLKFINDKREMLGKNMW